MGHLFATNSLIGVCVPTSTSVTVASGSPATVRTAVGDENVTTNNFTIPAGQKYVQIINVSPLAGGSVTAIPTVNGRPLYAGDPREFDAEEDPQTNEYVRSKEYVVVTNGASISYEYYK